MKDPLKKFAALEAKLDAVLFDQHDDDDDESHPIKTAAKVGAGAAAAGGALYGGKKLVQKYGADQIVGTAGKLKAVKNGIVRDIGDAVGAVGKKIFSSEGERIVALSDQLDRLVQLRRERKAHLFEGGEHKKSHKLRNALLATGAAGIVGGAGALGGVNLTAAALAHPVHGRKAAETLARMHGLIPAKKAVRVAKGQVKKAGGKFSDEMPDLSKVKFKKAGE